jgi:oligopeptide transport system substrate-binding protein
MSALKIELLGGIIARRDGQSIEAFESDKTRALLAYLAVKRDKTHRRETLAGLFWPEAPEARARANLNQAAYSLRHRLELPGEPPLLLSERHTLELNPAFDLRTDVAAFETALASLRHCRDARVLCDACRAALIAAADLYRGPLLDGFSLPGCAAFEEWLSLRREHLSRQAVEALRQLAACHEAGGDLAAAAAAARRWAELAPWQEAAHQRVMRLLALAGRRNEALAYYETCCRLLRDEIGVEPRESTRALVADIRAGRIRAREPAASLRPLTFEPSPHPAQPSRPRFVGRGAPLAEMHERLQQALAGEGQIVFVAGEAGSGKTALLHRFSQQAHAAHPNLLTVWGQGNAFAGGGDPYLPFRQVVGLLTGEARRGYEMGLLDEAQAQRLWSALPLAIDSLVGQAPDLIDAFLPGVDLLTRVSAAVETETDWLAALRSAEAKGKTQGTALNRRQLQEQTTAFLRDLSARRPLLLLLDDLHWADTDSLSLLFHLAQSLAGLHVLLVGAYRQEDVDSGRDGQMHPLKVLVAECKRLTGQQPINLNRLSASERRDFVEQLLDTERNRLDAAFRQALFEHTEGHALFTVETLREFAARGDILWQEDMGWVQQRPPAWKAISSRAQGVIEARLARLPPDMQELLAVASVEGEAFSAQTLVAALDRRPGEAAAQLNELDRVHRLVAEAGSVVIGGNRLDRYRFRHSLFRQYVYEGLGEAMRRWRHGQVGAILEATHGAQAHLIAPQLALHFDLAGDDGRALAWYLAAGDQARLLYADEPARTAYERALALARTIDDDGQAASIYMRLGLTHHDRMAFEQAQAAYAEGFRLWSQVIAEPAQSLPPAEQPLRLIWGLAPRNEEPTFDFISDLFSGLVAETPELSIAPDVAHRWEIKDGGRTYVFHLRDDVRWSDGAPVTARDFAFAWQHNRIPGLGAPLYEVKGGRCLEYGIAADLKQAAVEAPDPYTLVVRLPRPAAYFLHLLAHPLAAPKPRHVIERYGDAWASAEHVVSNGAFLLERWDRAGDKMHFMRNPTYHGRAAGNVERVEAYYFRQAAGWQGQLDLYEQDRIDILLILNWSRAGFETARRRHLAEYAQSPLFTTFGFCFDTRRPPFDDRRLRQAFAMSFEQTQAIAQLGRGIEKPTLGGFIPPGMPGHSPAIGLPFDPDRARQLLAEAGYPGGKEFPAIELAQFYTAGGDESCRYHVSQWRQQLGVTVTYKILEWTAYWRYLSQGSPHIMAMNGVPTYGDPDAFLRQSFRTVQTLSGWRHPDYDNLIDKASRSQDQRERLQLYQQADALLMQEAPIIPSIYHDTAYLAKPWVKQLVFSPLGTGGCWKDIVLAPRTV